jgi:hypothetical protein
VNDGPVGEMGLIMTRKGYARLKRTHPVQITSTKHREKGQSIVEMAILVPILILLVAIVIDATRAFDAYIVLTNAAREGARFGALQLNPTPIEVRDLVVNDVLGSGTNITHMETFGVDNVQIGGVLGLPRFHLQKEAVMPKFPAAGS